MVKNKRNVTNEVFKSSYFVPVEYLYDGIARDKSGNYFIVFKLKGPNIFLKNEKEQISLFLTFRDFLFSMSEQDKIQLIIATRVMKLLPFLDNLKKREANLSGKLRDYAEANINYLLELVASHELMEKAILLIVYLHVPSTEKISDKDLYAKEIAFKKEKYITEFFRRFDVKAERLSNEEILEYLFTELNPDLTEYPSIKAPTQVNILSELELKSLEDMGRYAPKPVQEKNQELVQPINKLVEESSSENNEEIPIF
ncbi:MAG: hypothetical protein QW134_04315 [Nitrososphaeria archaeon]